jgi:hypothetical protein
MLVPIYAQPGRIQDIEVCFAASRAEVRELDSLLPEILGPHGLIPLTSHYFALQDAASGVKEFNRSRAALASRFDNNLPITID